MTYILAGPGTNDIRSSTGAQALLDMPGLLFDILLFDDLLVIPFHSQCSQFPMDIVSLAVRLLIK